MCATHSPSVQAKACRLDNLARAKLAKDCVLRARTLRLKSRNWQRMAPCSHQRNCQQRQWLHLLHLGSTALPSNKQWLHDMQRKSRHCWAPLSEHIPARKRLGHEPWTSPESSSAPAGRRPGVAQAAQAQATHAARDSLAAPESRSQPDAQSKHHGVLPESHDRFHNEILPRRPRKQQNKPEKAIIRKW